MDETSVDEASKWQRRYEREKQARLSAEAILEERSRELNITNMELRQLASVLEHGVKMRTEELEKARDEAVSASRAKSEFLATMSHEIRTPLNGVLGMLHLLQNSQLNDRQQRFAETAVNSGKLLLTVINDILDYSKIEAGKMYIECIPFEPVALIEEVSTLLAKQANEKKLNYYCRIEADLPHLVKGDPTRLRQVLMNLLSNAIKFTEKGEVALHARATAHGVYFGVIDTGIGIGEEEKLHLFEAFRQLDGSHSRKYGGTGLGLTISQRLVQAMGGNLSVVSAPGKGSEFGFEIQFEVLEKSRLQQVSEILPRQRILVVDDNPTNRMIHARILESWRVQNIDHAENSLQAMEKLLAAAAAEKPFDLALIDMQMPGMDGGELVRRIRSHPAIKRTHLIMISSVTRDSNVTGIEAFLNKPVRQSELYNSVLMCLDDIPQIKAKQEKLAGECWFGGRMLLLVEDNPINQEVASELLGDCGLNIDICEDGEQAVTAVQQNEYDLVLMDIQMPILDGLEATRQIRALGGRYAKLPIIAMTANAMTGDAEKSFQVGMNGHIAKPIVPSELFHVLSQWMTSESRLAHNDYSGKKKKLETGLPKSLPGIDINDGLNRVLGNAEAYRRILLVFHDNQAAVDQKIAQMMASGNWQEATRLAHSLKGSAGNIGARDLYEKAAAMEVACRLHETETALRVLQQLRVTLDEVIAGLQTLHPVSVVENTAAGLLDVMRVSTLLVRMKDELDQDLGAAQATLAELHAATTGSTHSGAIAVLSSALNNFDIDETKRLLNLLQLELKDKT